MRDAARTRRPLGIQYVDFLTGALLGDWGVSLVTGRPVLEEILKVLPWTIELTVVSLIVGLLAGVPLGVWAAIRRNRAPTIVIRIVSLLGLSMPAFVSAVILLIVFAIQVRWFPVISAEPAASRPGSSRSRCRPSISASSWRPTSRA